MAAVQFFRRVVFGIVDASVASPAMATAAEFAHAFAVELCGVFIDDTLVFEAAALPELRAIEPRALQWHTLTADENARAQALAARAVERRLLEEAAAVGIGAAFRVERGDPAAALVQGVQSSDLLVFAEPDDPIARALPAYPRLVQALRATSAAVLFVPQGARRRAGPVVALTQSEHDEALALAEGVAAALRERLIVQPISGTATPPLTPRQRRERLLVISRAAVRDDLAGYLQLVRARGVPLLIAPAPAG